MIACCHPGKIGDALWSLPSVRELCTRHQCQADFFTSSYCSPLIDLLKAQPYIRNVVIPEGYVVHNFHCGGQPAHLPVPEGEYEKVYQFGFTSCPDKNLGEWMAETAGLPREAGSRMILENIPPSPIKGEYIALASQFAMFANEAIIQLGRECSVPIVEVGHPSQYIGAGINRTTNSMLEMASYISGARFYIGLMSAPLVIANAFPDLIKIIPHHEISGDPRHLLYTPNHHYLYYPVMPQLLSIIQQRSDFYSYSQSGQDRFAWLICNKDDGIFVDIGCNVADKHNNTLALEKRGWKGLLVDVADVCYGRNNPFVCCDATKPDANLQSHYDGLPDKIDYLSVDVDDATMAALDAFPLQRVRPSVITIEHDLYRRGPDLKFAIRSRLTALNYTLICEDVIARDYGVFEDWYVASNMAERAARYVCCNREGRSITNEVPVH